MKTQTLIPIILTIFLLTGLSAQSSYNVTLLDSSRADLEFNWWQQSDRCSGIWGWKNPQSAKEYALMGFFDHGWGFFDVSDPNNIWLLSEWHLCTLRCGSIPSYGMERTIQVILFHQESIFMNCRMGIIGN